MNEGPANVAVVAAPPVRSEETAAAGELAAAPTWPRWQRVGLRYLLIHFVLYEFPTLLIELLGTVAAGLSAVGLDTHVNPWRWPGKWVVELRKVETKGWEPLTTWMYEHGLTPYEVIHQPTGSGDTGHDIAKLLVIVVASLVLTAIWSLLQQGRRGHPRLGRWLHLVARFWLAFSMLGYGSAKLYGGQFGELSLGRLTQEIGDTWPMTMVGTFMQSSKPYEVFAGLGEVLGGLLLFHRRTALLGACVTIGVMMNVCAINWLCGVPVKLYSAHLLLCAVFLLAPHARNLWSLFVRNRASQPVDLAVVKTKWLAWPLLVFGFAWVLGSLASVHVRRTAEDPRMKAYAKSALYGLWTVEKMLLDGEEVPVRDATRWQFLAIDRGTMAWTRDATGQRRYFRFEWDPATGIAQVHARGDGADVAAAPWTCEQGTKVVPVPPPLLLRKEDRGHNVDGTRRSLVVKGKLGDQQLELHTVEKVFPLQTGFRLRQELPDFW